MLRRLVEMGTDLRVVSGTPLPPGFRYGVTLLELKVQEPLTPGYLTGVLKIFESCGSMLHLSAFGLESTWTDEQVDLLCKVTPPPRLLIMTILQIIKSSPLLSLNAGEVEFTVEQCDRIAHAAREGELVQVTTFIPDFHP